MTITQSVLLGILQGLTEFLPISSTAHLILAGKLMHLPETEFLKTYDVVIQAGSAFAVLILWGYRLVSKPKLLGKVFIAFLPTAVLGLILHDIVKEYLYNNTTIIACALAAGGLAMLFIDRRNERGTEHELEHVTTKQAFGVGCIQSLALIPGVSRSAASICGGMLLGLHRRDATEFSFMLAIPTLLAASALDLVKALPTLQSNDVPLLGVGFVAALVSSIVVMQWLLRYVTKNRFTPFAFYRIALAVAIASVLL